MTVKPDSQLTLNFDAGLTDIYKSCLDAVRDRIYKNPNPLKTIAADMDLSTSDLSRKLSENPDDVRKFTLADFEGYLAATKDYTPLYYLIEKYLADKDLHKLLQLEIQENQKLRAELETITNLVQIKKAA